MASKSEKGIAKKVANFQELVSFCSSLGSAYNPGRTAIQLPQLSTMKTSAAAAVYDVKTSDTALQTATILRRTEFADLRKTSTRIIDYLRSTEVTPERLEDAKGFQRKVQGARASKIPEGTVTESGEIIPPTIHSTSQQSFDNQLEAIEKLIVTISAEPSYAPNELDLTVLELTTWLGTMKSINLDAVNAKIEYENSLVKRDKIMKTPVTGMKDIGMASKAYIRALFGVNSPEYKQISHLTF